MTDLISRRAAIKAIDDLPNCYNGYSDTYDKACIIGVLEELPSVDVPDRKVGKWIYPTDIVGFGRCENCKALWDVSLIRNKFFKHCPRCGHPMERNAEILKMANEQVEYLRMRSKRWAYISI